MRAPDGAETISPAFSKTSPATPSGPMTMDRCRPGSTSRVESPPSGISRDGRLYSPGPPPCRPTWTALPRVRSTSRTTLSSRSTTRTRPSPSSRTEPIPVKLSLNSRVAAGRDRSGAPCVRAKRIATMGRLNRTGDFLMRDASTIYLVESIPRFPQGQPAEAGASLAPGRASLRSSAVKRCGDIFPAAPDPDSRTPCDD